MYYQLEANKRYSSSAITPGNSTHLPLNTSKCQRIFPRGYSPYRTILIVRSHPWPTPTHPSNSSYFLGLYSHWVICERWTTTTARFNRRQFTCLKQAQDNHYERNTRRPRRRTRRWVRYGIIRRLHCCPKFVKIQSSFLPVWWTYSNRATVKSCIIQRLIIVQRSGPIPTKASL